MFYCSTHGGKCKASGVLRPHSFLSLFGERKEPCRAAKKRKRRPGKPFGWFPRTPSIDQSLALDLRRMEVGESTIDFVGADAERSCSRRRSVTDAACPLRVLIGPLMQPHFLFSARKGNGVARQRKRGLCETGSTSRAGIASEEGCSVPLPPGRRKFHIRSLLLPSQIVTVHWVTIWF